MSAYEAKSYMLSSSEEFFVCSATTYLFGETFQEPFHREKMAAAQPELIAFYHQLFGPGTGTYQGNIDP